MNIDAKTHALVGRLFDVFFTNSISDPEEAEVKFRNGLELLKTCQVKANTILEEIWSEEQ